MIKLQRIILTSPPVSFLVRKSKQISLPGFEGIPLFDVVRFFVQQTQQVGLNERAASISFNFLLAVPPLGIFLFKLLSNMPGSKKLYNEAINLARQVAPDRSSFEVIKNVMDDFFTMDSRFLSFGVILAVFFSSNAMITIMRTFNKSMLHIETERRNFLQLRWEAIKLTFYIVIMILATIGILVTQGSFFGYLAEWLEIPGKTLSWAGQIIRILITFLLVFISIALIYRFAPSVRKKWKLTSPGSLLATFLIIGFTVLFSFWVNNIASYNKVYGSLGGILILMLLIYVNSLVLLIGFELNVSINSLKSIAQRREQQEADDRLD